MPTVAEMQLLNGSLDSLASTLMQNRQMTRQRERDSAQDRLSEEMMGIHREDLAGRREDRKRASDKAAEDEARKKQILDDAQTKAAIARLDAAHKALQDRVDAGAMTPEEAEAQAKHIQDSIQNAGKLTWENSRFGMLGTGFKKGPGLEPQPWQHPVTKENFVFNPKTGNYERSKKPTAGTVTSKPDPNNPDGPWIDTIRRDMGAEDLDQFMKSRVAQPDPASGPSPDEQTDINEIMSRPAIDASGPPPTARPRINTLQAAPAQLQDTNSAPSPAVIPAGPPSDKILVIHPSGAKGYIPRGQLPQALAQGYKLAQ